MTIFQFLLYDLISFIIHFVVILLLYKVFTKHKCNIISNIADKQIEDYFNAYESDIVNVTDTLNDMNNSQTTDDSPKFF